MQMIRHRRVANLSVLTTLIATVIILFSGTFFLPTVSAVSLGCQERLQNGNFETGRTPPWVESPSGPYSLISGLLVHNGDWAAWLGGGNDADDDLYQEITIPSGITTAELSFWWYVQTQEQAHPNDFLSVTVRDTSNNILVVLTTFNDGSPELVWVQSTHNVAAYAGQTVRIGFHATTDVSNLTSFFIDDVSLTVCADTKYIYLPFALKR